MCVCVCVCLNTTYGLTDKNQKHWCRKNVQAMQLVNISEYLYLDDPSLRVLEQGIRQQISNIIFGSPAY